MRYVQSYTDRHEDRQAGRQETDRQIGTPTRVHTYRERERERERERDACIHTYTRIDRHIYINIPAYALQSFLSEITHSHTATWR